MGIEIEKTADATLSLPVSTGAVTFDGNPLTTEVVIDNGSTGAVALAGPVTTTLTWPSEAQSKPVESPVEAGQLADEVQTKPVTAPKRGTPKGSGVKVETK